MEAGPGARPAPTSSGWSSSRSTLRAELREMRGGRAVGDARRTRAARSPRCSPRCWPRDDAVVLVGTIDDVVVGYGTIEVEILADGPAWQ